MLRSETTVHDKIRFENTPSLKSKPPLGNISFQNFQGICPVWFINSLQVSKRCLKPLRRHPRKIRRVARTHHSPGGNRVSALVLYYRMTVATEAKNTLCLEMPHKQAVFKQWIIHKSYKNLLNLNLIFDWSKVRSESSDLIQVITILPTILDNDNRHLYLMFGVVYQGSCYSPF